jgi:hypothetical protein
MSVSIGNFRSLITLAGFILNKNLHIIYMYICMVTLKRLYIAQRHDAALYIRRDEASQYEYDFFYV